VDGSWCDWFTVFYWWIFQRLPAKQAARTRRFLQCRGDKFFCEGPRNTASWEGILIV
jgi:hypothetical protein